MEKIKAAMMSPSVRRLLAFATSEKNIEPAYKLYCQVERRNIVIPMFEEL
ncbi:hypothetical protein [Lysinibacillus piscis]|uniref:Uncharacterized protein n=1 Tax=Lysinibacillus piscis TaxID=2518931 RepID=A0ABQ5NFT2_9BACI|nr:hypothetical protein [Lysinibacillus sp. KH24]GLC87140.1 hypothetical protein LYSBPC_02670 [Lysinibacillus sp. KH24]